METNLTLQMEGMRICTPAEESGDNKKYNSVSRWHGIITNSLCAKQKSCFDLGGTCVRGDCAGPEGNPGDEGYKPGKFEVYGKGFCSEGHTCCVSTDYVI